MIENISITIRNYKCFGNDQRVHRIAPINLIIGRNNSGKSTLLDILSYLTNPCDLTHLAHKSGQRPIILLERILSNSELQSSVKKIVSNPSGSTAPSKYVANWEGKPFIWEVEQTGGVRFVSLDPPFRSSNPPFGLELLPFLEGDLLKRVGNPFSDYSFKRLLADRDVLPEMDDGPGEVAANGAGTTRVIQRFINKVSLPRELVEVNLLRDLNAIFEPDGTFTRISIRQLGTGHWEIYLDESGKGSIPLSHSGSGVKTVVLVLVFVHLIPYLEKRNLSRYIFGFEELENNLHPALQRRLLVFLDVVAREHKCRFFLTTHSSVAIDLFAQNDDAQILHVTHNREHASIKRVSSYGESKGILDDLDIRASDLLQANGIVWVEGPSDRLYFNRWIELWSDGNIRENVHYQCVYYGGSLLAHLSADDPEIDIKDFVRILKVNRNATLILDSDRTLETDPLNPTKNRLIEEVERMGGMAWVTMGRTIENYIPVQALGSLYEEESIPDLMRYQSFPEYLAQLMPAEGKRFRRNKVLFARKVLRHITKESIETHLDLLAKIVEAGQRIYNWNGLSAS